jgi:hypothetical protein
MFTAELDRRHISYLRVSNTWGQRGKAVVQAVEKIMGGFF